MKLRLFISAVLCFILVINKSYSQDIHQATPVVLPQAPSTNYVVSPGQTVKISSSSSVVLSDGVHFQAGSNVRVFIGNTPTVVPAPSNPATNIDLNWVTSKTYDENGNVVAEDKSFYDRTGKLLQNQVKSLSTGHVFASQPIYDAQSRAAISTLQAPINNTAFNFKADFVTNDAGIGYNYLNFDKAKTNNPDPVNSNNIGTLGWYYSNNNTFENYVPVTAYPYSRTAFYNDGSEAIKNTSGVGDELRMGRGHEISSGSFPVLNELDYYNTVRLRFFPESVVGSRDWLTKKALQSYSVDQNGNAELEITDLSGKTLMFGRADANGILSVNNSVTINEVKKEYTYTLRMSSLVLGSGNNPNAGGFGDGPKSFGINSKYNVKVFKKGTLEFEGVGNDYVFNSIGLNISGATFVVTSDYPFSIYHNDGCDNCPSKIAESDVSTIHYFRLLQPSNVSISGSHELYDMNTESQVQAGILPAGYYKARALNGNVNISYTSKLSDISFVFYNQKGDVLASIPPEGVKALLTNGIESYASLTDIPFVNTNEYDIQGRLIASTTVDAGKTEFIYRKDGNIRFSQNAEQRKSGRFSYNNYDLWDRIFESGEYLPGDISFESAKTNTALQEDNSANGGLTGGTRKSQTITHYDLPDQGHGLAGYTQDEFFLKGVVSWTENENAKTWYNYDEQGRLKWSVKSINGLGVKTFNYSYDNAGLVTAVDYQRETPAERFVHHYDYDADLRLNTVYTSLDGINKLLQAQYYYYLHGPLKRVELAENLQGIDYTYTAQGLLKTINHPEGSNDPGKDGSQNSFAPDAFAMTLEYFNGDYSRAGTNINSLNPNSNKAYYNGNITAQSWRSLKPNAIVASYGQGVNSPAMFTYEYDDKYQFNNNKFGSPGFSNNTFNEQQNINREHGLSYDANGNIQSLNRNNALGSQLTLSYHYQANTNRLQSVDNYASYSYNELGQMVGQQRANGQGFYLNYNASGKVEAIYADVAKTQLRLSYGYDETGKRIRKTDHLQNINTYYVYDLDGNLLSIYDNNGGVISQKELFLYGSDRLGSYTRLNNNYQYELTDNLGNVRAVVNRNKTNSGQVDVVYYSDYYPFGSPLTLANNAYRFGYQGKYAEADQETGWNNFELRMYDPAIGRWMSTDPAGQYDSPYLAMGNNPVDHVDPDGGKDGTDPEKTYVAGGKDLEVTVSAKRMSSWERMAYRSDNGLDKFKYANGRTDYEAMAFNNTYTAMKTPKDLQWYLIEAAMYADGAEGAFMAGKFLYKGGGYLARRYFTRKIGIEVVEVAAEEGMTTVYRNFGWKEYKALRSAGNKFEIGSNFGSKQFWLDKEGITWWNSTSFSKNFTAKISVKTSALNDGYKFLDAGKYRAISFDSPDALNIFNRNMNIEWIQYR